MRKITYLLALLAAGSAFAQEDCNLQYDGNGDGAVNIEDVLGILSEFGETCESETEASPCGLESSVSYYGYDYQIVAIGDQCWFAENLRTERYANGDSIPSQLSDSDWFSTANGAVAVFGEDEGCESYSTEGDGCDPEWSLDQFGRLYNWYAVNDSRGLCPSGWHVPTDSAYMILEIELGVPEWEVGYSGWRGTTQGFDLKATYSWALSGSEFNTNSTGFSALSSGERRPSGYFGGLGLNGYWWTSTSGGTNYAFYRELGGPLGGISRGNDQKIHGWNVRCLKD